LLAYTAQYRGDTEGATSLAEQCLNLSKEINAPRAMAYCNEVFGLAAFSRNHLSEARDLFNKAIEIFEKLGDRRNVASVLIHLARTAYRPER
jgi:tetratricopeptide (TPR) repeat protein